ncbi:PREDICTED: uncharacterized protein LOC104733404 [Camelina sativa]|uniref:Uncharacterized protein LOC104733404 n=1 Tax=Camelina sativa TaxID=90675 RepID=A0ABM0V5W6_CAMSA|nr:PREDICTED: uncharacterized protein LOC104733404 [Camelina sativa]
MDDTSKEVVYKVATSKEVENDTSFEEQLLETTSSQDYRNKEYEQANLKAHVEIKPSSTPSDLASKIIPIKAKLIPNSLHATREDEVDTNNILFQEEPPDQSLNQPTLLILNDTLIDELCQEPPDLKAQAQIQRGAKHATQSTMIPDQNRGVILSFLLKGEQLDAPHITKPKPYRGRGYDADIRTKPNREHGEPTSPHTKPVHEEHLGESFPKWSSDQAQREGKVFNEATPSHQGITYHPSDSKMAQEVIAEVLVELLAGPAELLADRHAELLPDGLELLADESDIVASYEEFRPFDTWTSPRGSPHTYLIHHKSPAHGEQPKRRPKSKPPFESCPLIYLEPDKETFIYIHLDVSQSYIWKLGEPLKPPENIWRIFTSNNSHWIRRIQSYYYLPFSDPIVINAQRLLPNLIMCIVKFPQVAKKFPRRHNFLPKLTRYKTHLLTLFGPILHLMVQRSYVQ